MADYLRMIAQFANDHWVTLLVGLLILIFYRYSVKSSLIRRFSIAFIITGLSLDGRIVKFIEIRRHLCLSPVGGSGERWSRTSQCAKARAHFKYLNYVTF